MPRKTPRPSRSKLPPVPTDDALVVAFTAQVFKDAVVAAFHNGARRKLRFDVEVFAAGALSAARSYAVEAARPARPSTKAYPRKPPRTEAALTFMMHLQLAYADATDGEVMPGFTATWIHLGPFARVAMLCLPLIKSPILDAVELINILQKRADQVADRRGQARRGKPNDRRRKKSPGAPNT
jgi:hypothetical protein